VPKWEDSSVPDPDPDLATRDVLAADVAQRLAMDIVTLRLAPGSRLIEEEIGRRFGISRSPVREAIRMLEADGLTRRAPRRGSIIAPMSRADLEDVYACRLALEPLASAGAACCATAEGVVELRACWLAMRDARDRADPDAAFLANMRLTATLHAQCGNPVLHRLLSSVDKQGLRYRFVSYSRLPAFLTAAVEENATLVAAIDARDAASAAEVTARLVAEALRNLRALFPPECSKDGRPAEQMSGR
jgi:DNA-binding GntR family transcriptional regulator